MNKLFGVLVPVVALLAPVAGHAVTIGAGANTSDVYQLTGADNDAADNRAFEYTASEDLLVNFSVSGTGSADDLGDILFGYSIGTLDFAQATNNMDVFGDGFDPESSVGGFSNIALMSGQTLYVVLDGQGRIDQNASGSVDLRASAADVNDVPLPASALLLLAGMGGLVAARKGRKSA